MLGQSDKIKLLQWSINFTFDLLISVLKDAWLT